MPGLFAGFFRNIGSLGLGLGMCHGGIAGFDGVAQQVALMRLRDHGRGSGMSVDAPMSDGCFHCCRMGFRVGGRHYGRRFRNMLFFVLDDLWRRLFL